MPKEEKIKKLEEIRKEEIERVKSQANKFKALAELLGEKDFKIRFEKDSFDLHSHFIDNEIYEVKGNTLKPLSKKNVV